MDSPSKTSKSKYEFYCHPESFLKSSCPQIQALSLNEKIKSNCQSAENSVQPEIDETFDWIHVLKKKKNKKLTKNIIFKIIEQLFEKYLINYPPKGRKISKKFLSKMKMKKLPDLIDDIQYRSFFDNMLNEKYLNREIQLLKAPSEIETEFLKIIGIFSKALRTGKVQKLYKSSRRNEFQEVDDKY